MAAGRIPELERLGLSWPELAEMEQKMGALEGEQREAARELSEAKDALERAKREDAEAYASALLEGKKEPSGSAVEAARARIDALERRARGLSAALSRLRADRDALVRERSEAWRAEVLELLPAKKAEVERLAGALGRALSEIDAVATVHDWLAAPERPFKRKSPMRTVVANHQRVAVAGVLSAVVAQASGLEAREPEETA